VPSNLANTQRRYELIPYTYSLAYRAWLYGEPVVPPLVYYHQNDPNVRTVGHEKLLGHDLLAGIVAAANEFKRDIYLPTGDWASFDTNEWFHSTGTTFAGLPEYRGGIFRLPLFARAGAIIPTMHVDHQTGNALGFRRDGSTRNELIARVYASPTVTSFTLYEDDGQTISYKAGAYRTTVISQQKTGGASETVTIAASSGTYVGAPTSRNNIVTLAVENQQATAVTLNGVPLTRHTTKAQFDAASSGWWNAGYNVIRAKSGIQPVATDKTFVFTLTSATAQASVNFVCTNGTTTPGQSVFVVGNIPQLGGWNVANAIKLDPNVYPTWTGDIQNLPPNTTIEWKCIKRNNNDNGNLVWEPDGSPNRNNTIATPGSGYGGSTTDGGF
jgi:alpha-glucosidase